MSEFHELIKKFSKCRNYVRDFFVYGYKSRSDFSHKSGRTYDDERRRIESWLGDFVCQDYQENTKNISLQMDSNLLETNPLYRVWKTKSFTNADISLHFYLLDLLGSETWLSVNALTDKILDQYEVSIDPQMVRRKCKEYEKEGLLLARKEGKTVFYSLGMDMAALTRSTTSIDPDLFRQHILDAISFFALSAPFGIIGSTILDQQFVKNTLFRIKHSFLVHTLEDEVLLTISNAMQTHSCVRLALNSGQKKSEYMKYGLPLRIFVSTRTGRRYLCLYQLNGRSDKGQFHGIRLDQIQNVELCSVKNTPDPIYLLTEKTSARHDEILQKLNQNQDMVWGISFHGNYKTTSAKRSSLPRRSRQQTIHLTLYIDEDKDLHILHRLEREGKGGEISHIAPNTYRYEKTLFDAQETFPWLRTFIGRILELKVTEAGTSETLPPVINHHYSDQFYRDLEQMYEMYQKE